MPEPTTSSTPSPAAPDATGPVPCGCATSDASAPPSGWRGALARLPRVPTAVVLVGLLLLGYVLGGPVGGVLVAAGLVAFAVVIAAGWPGLSRAERLLRIAVFVLLLGLALVRLLPR